MLSIEAFLLALLLGVTTFLAFGMEGFVILMAFFTLSIFATEWKRETKKRIGFYEEQRGVKNVISNGFVAFLAALSKLVSLSFPFPFLPLPAFLGSLAAATADKFASEIGILEKKAFFLGSFKFEKRGKSGSISPLGLFASFLGSSSIALISYLFFPITGQQMLLIAIAGFLGSFADSIAGVFEEFGIGNKETSNLVCTFFSAILLSYLW